MQPKTQLIAHDKEVYDIAFACGKDVFGTVGADGSLRMFDLRYIHIWNLLMPPHLKIIFFRSLEHSTILYESPDLTPLLRLAWNKQDPNYLATILTASEKAVILDIRLLTWHSHQLCLLNLLADDKFTPLCACVNFSRMPSMPVAELIGHQAAINGIAWAPHSPCHICTCRYGTNDVTRLAKKSKSFPRSM